MSIEEIPDPKNYSEIYTAFKNDKLVVFVGAGISHLWGCERWENLSKKLIDEFHEKEEFNYRTCEILKDKFQNNPRKLLTIAQQKNQELYIIQRAQASLEPSEHKS